MNVIHPEDWQAERLANWLLDWELLQVPCGEEDEAAEEPVGDNRLYSGSTSSCHQLDAAEAPDDLPPECVAPADKEIEVGQVRLMIPQRADEAPLYLAVVKAEDGETVCCVPFSRLSVPATPDELLSGRETPAVRVYCLWNTASVSLVVLGESWIVDTLTGEELGRLTRARLSVEKTGSVPIDLRQEAGPPLFHPEDPRRIYRRQEEERLDHILVREHTGHAHDNIILYDIESGTEDRELPKAAEDRDEYGE